MIRICHILPICFVLCFLCCSCITLSIVDENNLSHIPLELAASTFKPSTSKEVNTLLEKTGGRIKGVCHPNEDYQTIKEANINWVRFDCTSLPYDENGNPTPGYLAFKKRAQGYADQGIKVFCVTPYPSVYIENGYDPRTPEGEAKVIEFAEFYAKDLQGIVAAFQITNEMGIEHFTLPLNQKEAARFIGVQLKAMAPYKKNIITGYNLTAWWFHSLSDNLKPYMDYVDYVGVDLYFGCFEQFSKETWLFNAAIKSVWSQTQKPIVLCEFGYMGYGTKKTKAEKNAILANYGFSSEKEARNNVLKMINSPNFPPKFKNFLLNLDWKDEKDLAHKVFDTENSNHLYRELKSGFELRKYKHTPEDQGLFFTDTISRLKKLDYLCGAIVYCMSDSDACYICGQKDCPVETGWGLLDGEGNKKPAYYAVREAFKNWN